MRWRHWFRVLHRDFGYAAVSLTLAYSISGIAVNHIQDWNPNYSLAVRDVAIGPLPTTDYRGMQDYVVESLSIDPALVRGHFLESENEFRVFLKDAQEVRVNVRDGRGVFKHLRTRAALYEMNLLHLNRIRGVWTWVADLFAVVLVLLSFTGIFLLKGPKGLGGRGKWFVVGGTLLPLAFLVWAVWI